VCFARGGEGRGRAGERGWGAAAVARRHRVLETAVVEGAAGAPYEPGLLALREGRLLEHAVRALDVAPDVLLVNASGADHPRGAGLAVHLGALLDLPSVGVTDRPLLASGAPPGPRRGDSAPLELGGREVARWLTTRTGARALVVHPGWRTGIEDAVALVLGATRRARTPTPLRAARAAARAARADAAG
jgi:deoxyribonuclease V